MSKLLSNIPSPPRCPLNYFGKGENYNLQEASPEEMQKYNEDFAAWEAAHPDDPIGEKALEAYKLEYNFPENPRTTGKAPSSRPSATEVHNSFPSVEQSEADENLWTPLRLMLPEDDVEKLKRYAKRRKLRPRDVIREWIEKHC